MGALEDGPRALFARMGAFAGPVELEDIEAVAREDGFDVLESLASLLDVALVRRIESGDGLVRFRLPMHSGRSPLASLTPRQMGIAGAARTPSTSTTSSGRDRRG